MNFGIECELESGTADILPLLGLDHLHDYHCECGDCCPHRHAPDWTAQEDCTADGELISRILAYGTPSADAAIDRLGDVLREARATTSTNQGLHVHVGTEDMTPESWVRMWRIWFRYQDEVADLARGRFRHVRSYNQPNVFTQQVSDAETFWKSDDLAAAWRTVGRPYFRTAWLNANTCHDTVEFRLWNATRATWRIHLAVGVSTAILAAAIDGVDVTEHDPRPLAEVIGPYLSVKSHAALVRHYISEEAA